MTAQRALRITSTGHPLLFEVNARVLATRLSASAGAPVSLGDVPDVLLDEWQTLGYDAVWMMGVWETGPIGRSIARNHPGLEQEYRKVLPDVTDADVVGSPYAVQA